jgi:hypothetical protein
MSGAGLRRAAARLRRIGRMTLEDAADLASVFAQVAGRQAHDALRAARRRVRPPRPG